MSYHLTKMGVEVLTNPARAAQRLAALYVRHRGRTVDVAQALGVSTSTVKRWVQYLDALGCALRARIRNIRSAASERRHG